MLPNQNGQDVIINFLVNMSQTNKNFDLLSARISNIRGQMKDMAEKVGADWKTIQKSMLETFKAQINAPDSQIPQAQRAAMIKLYSSALSQATTEMAKMQKQEEQFAASTLKAADAQQKAAKATTTWVGGLTKLSLAAKIVIGNVLGFTLTGMLRDLVGFFRQAIADALDLSRSFYILTEAVNSFRRKGIDITMADAAQTIDEMRQSMSYFNNKELVSGIALVYNLTRNFGFANDQIKNMINMSAGISVMTGKTFDEAAKQLALFISSGYGEGLQRAGLAVNRIAVAEEARRQGIDKSYMALTELQRAQMAYNVLMKQSVDLQEASKDYEETAPGRIKKIQAETENLSIAMGTKLIPAYERLQVLKKVAVEALNFILNELARFAEWAAKPIGYFVSLFMTAFQVIMTASHGYRMTLTEITQAFADNWASFTEAIKTDTKNLQQSFSDLNNLGKEIPLGQAPSEFMSDEDVEAMTNAVIGLYDDLKEAQQTFYDKSAEIERERLEKLDELDKEFKDKNTELWEDYTNDILKLQHELADDIADANEDYQKDVAEINKDEKKAIEDSNEKYHEAVLKEERDFQERMRKLREEFLFDLQDALRQRDALAVLNLIRRYELDQQQATREHENRLQELKEAHADELQEIKESNAEKLAERKAELEQELADLREAEAEKEAERLAAYEKEKQEAWDAYQEKVAETQSEYDQRLRDLKKSLDDQINEILKAFTEEYMNTTYWGMMITNVLGAFFGQQGVAQKIIDYYTATINSAWENANQKMTDMENILIELKNVADQINSIAPGTVETTLPDTQEGQQGGNQQTGSVMYASSPKTVTFGETPELATFTPLSQIGKLFGGKGGKQKVAIALSLSPDLEARIVDESMHEFADVMIERTR